MRNLPLVIAMLIVGAILIIHAVGDQRVRLVEAATADTVYSVTHTSRVDTVLSVPADTVHVIQKVLGGELTRADLVTLICPPSRRADDHFWHTPERGYVVCISQKEKDDRKSGS